MDYDPNILNSLSFAIQDEYVEPSATKEGLKFLMEFRESGLLNFLHYMILLNSNEEETTRKRKTAAILLFTNIHKKTAEAQRRFVTEWMHFDIYIREKFRVASTQGLLSDESDFIDYSSVNLGLFYAMELSSIGQREGIIPTFYECFRQLLEIAENSVVEKERITFYKVFKAFATFSVELNPNCTHDHHFYYTYCPRLFYIFCAGLQTAQMPYAQREAASALEESLMIFKRQVSFPQQMESLMRVISESINAGDQPLIPSLFNLIRKLIDYYYPYMVPHMMLVEELTFKGLEAWDNEEIIISICFVWTTIGEVESDIKSTDQKSVKRRHRDFDICGNFSTDGFNQLFNVLVQLIANTDASETDAKISLDRTSAHAAFSCLNGLTKAVDELCLGPIIEFVTNNSENEDWRFRYASALLLNAASQVNSFAANSDNILIAFKLFTQSITDPVPRICEVAMWSLGRMIDEIPELIQNPYNFTILTQQVSYKIQESSELASRSCWLLNTCFEQFNSDMTDTPLVTNFEYFSDLLLNTSDNFDDIQDAAFGALNRLIERTPSEIVELYNDLFEKVTDRLKKVVDNSDNSYQSPKTVHMIIGLLSIVQAITINVGPMISNVADSLIQILTQVLCSLNGDLINEVLPAIGAVARAIGNNFSPYLETFLDTIITYLQTEEFVQPAAVFIGDIYNSIDGISDEITQRFVQLLFNALQFDTISTEARIAVFTALGDIAKYSDIKFAGYIDSLIQNLDDESKSYFNDDDETIDIEGGKSFILINLSIYLILVQILAKIPRGDRRVRNFFHLFDKIITYNWADDDIYEYCVNLINVIANTFERRMNVYLNKPSVTEILKRAVESDDQLSELAQETIQKIRLC